MTLLTLCLLLSLKTCSLLLIEYCMFGSYYQNEWEKSILFVIFIAYMDSILLIITCLCEVGLVHPEVVECFFETISLSFFVRAQIFLLSSHSCTTYPLRKMMQGDSDYSKWKIGTVRKEASRNYNIIVRIILYICV